VESAVSPALQLDERLRAAGRRALRGSHLCPQRFRPGVPPGPPAVRLYGRVGCIASGRAAGTRTTGGRAPGSGRRRKQAGERSGQRPCQAKIGARINWVGASGLLHHGQGVGERLLGCGLPAPQSGQCRIASRRSLAPAYYLTIVAGSRAPAIARRPGGLARRASAPSTRRRPCQGTSAGMRDSVNQPQARSERIRSHVRGIEH
jgi:hypothetical protein